MKALVFIGVMVCVAGLAMEARALSGSNDLAIVSFGDSTTAPRVVDGQALTVYSDLLRAELAGFGIGGTVLNKGVGGNTTNDALGRFNADVLNQNPDLTIIQFGINDAIVNVWQNPPATAPTVSRSQYAANLTSMVRQLKDAGSRVVLMTPNPMRWTPVLVGYYGKPPYDVSDPMGLNRDLADYAQSVREIAEREGVGLVDVYELFTAYGSVPGQTMDSLLLDGMHPNADGHRLVADALEAAIVPEPGMILLLGAGGLGRVWRRRGR